MTTPNSPDRSQARAIIIAAIIGLIGVIAAAFLGREVGEKHAEVDTARLEQRLDQQESAFRSLQAELADRDVRIKSLTTKLNEALAARNRISPPDHLSSAAQAVTTDLSPAGQEPLAVDRIAPFQIALQGCDHVGGGLICKLLIENTSSNPANLALNQSGTVVFVEGSECRLSSATLGSRRWSAEHFGAIRVESGIPLVASLQFTGVPSAATSGALRFVVAVVDVTGPPAFFGANPDWQSVMFKAIPLG